MKQTFTGPDGITYTYDYDSNNQLTTANIPATGYITVNSYTWNRAATMTLPGGSTKEFTYDPLMRVESIIAKDPPQNPILDYQYTYDKMDNIVGKSTEHGDYVYDYDDLYRLNNVDNPVQDDEAFTYDSVGNRLTSLDVVGDWAYNQNNELGSYDGVSFVYDDNGNMIQKDDNGTVTNYIYNEENRLARVEDGVGSPIAEYYYDPFGRRLWKDVGGSKTCFFYSDEGLVGEYDGAGVEIKTYGYRPGSTWTTDPLFMKEGAEYYFYHNDHLGTPQKMTGYSGNVVWSSKYESFGEATVEVEDVENNLRFPGQYYDSESGLHFNGYRYYDYDIGRYLRQDPSLVSSASPYIPFLLRFHMQTPQSMNPFGFVDNNPIVFVDAPGLCKWTGSLWLIGGAARIYGGIIAQLTVKSECCMGWRSEATYNILAGGISILGIPRLPIQFVVTEITEMQGPDPPSWEDGNGLFSYVSVGAGGGVGRHRIGRSYSHIGSGDLYTVEEGSFLGFDAGIDAMFGGANGWGRDIPCDCEQEN